MTSLPGKFHTNILIDSRLRDSGTAASFSMSLDSDVHVPMGARGYLTCTRWSVDTSRVTPRERRRGRSLQLRISSLVTSSDVIDMGRGGVPTSCTAFITTIDNSFTNARMSSAAAHPMLVPGGLSMTRFDCEVQEFDGSLADLLGIENTTSDAFTFDYTFSSGTLGTITLAEDQYFSVEDLNAIIGDHLVAKGLNADDIVLTLDVNWPTVRIDVKGDVEKIDFDETTSIAPLLGYTNKVLTGTGTFYSDTTLKLIGGEFEADLMLVIYTPAPDGSAAQI